MRTGDVLASRDAEFARVATALIAIFGAIMSAACVGSYLLATSGRLTAMFDPAFALSLPPAGQGLFRFSQVADCLGYYMPFVVIGAYLRNHLRNANSAIVDLAFPFVIISSVLGIAGSAMQIAALPPLTTMYSDANPSVHAGAAVAWLAVVHGTENGLWLLEGPTLGFWAVVTGAVLARHQRGLGILLAMTGVAYLLYTGFALLGAAALARSLELVILPTQLVWEALFGIALLRRLHA